MKHLGSYIKKVAVSATSEDMDDDCVGSIIAGVGCGYRILTRVIRILAAVIADDQPPVTIIDLLN
jgi:hypothetical protein